jgi:hypothetical protein
MNPGAVTRVDCDREPDATSSIDAKVGPEEQRSAPSKDTNIARQDFWTGLGGARLGMNMRWNILTRSTALVAALALICVVGLGAWLLWAREQQAFSLRPAVPKAGSMPVAWDAPEFSFLDQDNRPVTKASLRSQVWIADFIFTHCGNTCPRMTATRVELQKRLPDARVTFVSFSDVCR